MTHRAHRGTARRPAPGQASFGWVQAPVSAAGYCSPCNREYRDIIRHRTADSHRARTYITATVARGTLPTVRPTWARAIRDYEDQYAQDDPGNSAAWDDAQAAAY